ncbi:MAG: PfkB family carbohydrate kinase [Terracidiphilus sp.]|jgi:sugar/nucleoside kinase (ribokinase family)
MAITVVGSVAFDTIETPAGKRDRCLGGAATYFSLAASYFTDVRVIAVVGEDFGRRQEAVFQARKIDTRGIEHMAGKSFFWEGSYLENMNEAKTHITDLNVFAAFEPKIPDVYRDSEFLFLANIDPILQRRVREAMPDVKLVAGDTMNYWIKDHRPALLEVLKGLDILLINDTETKMIAGNNNLVQAARAVMALGPKELVVKHGEYGATLFLSESASQQVSESAEQRKSIGVKAFRAPAMPLEEVIDPTGAGDSFAGGFFGYLASQPEQSPTAYRRAMFYGGVMGSFACERFGTERLQTLTRAEIDERFNLFRELTHLA